MTKIIIDKKKLKVLKTKDKTDNFSIKVNQLFDIPFRLILCGSSGQGKSNLLINLLLNNNFGYTDIFDGDRIMIFSPTIKSDEKLNILVNEKDIPSSNLFENFSDDLLEEVYDLLVDDFKDAISNGEKPKHTLIILDDLAFSSKLSKRFSALGKVFCNGRKFLVSCICLTQTYTSIAKNIRINSSGLIIFNTSNKELEIIEKENNFLNSKSSFYEMFREYVKERFQFLVINYSNNFEELYLDSEFQVIN